MVWPFWPRPAVLPPLPPIPRATRFGARVRAVVAREFALDVPAIALTRAELAEIRTAITEALPRHAIESLEGEIRLLARRIDDNRQSAVDGNALSSVERALAEIREVLRSLMQA